MRYLIKYYLLAIIILSIGCIDLFEHQEQEEDPEKKKISTDIIASLNGDILYCNQHNRLLYVNDVLIADNVGSSVRPQWSNDGTKIAYYLLDDDHYIRIINYEGVEISKWFIAQNKQLFFIRSITWSTDNNTIAFLHGYGRNNRITYLNVTTGELITIPLENEPRAFSTIAWNPVYNIIAISEGAKIYLMEPYQTAPPNNQSNLILTNTDPLILLIKNIDWSHNGQMLTYSSGSTSPIYISNIDGTNHRQLTLSGIYEDERLRGFSPCWSPDDTQILYTGVTGLDGSNLIFGLFVVDIEGTYNVDINKSGMNADWK